ncbi:MAG: glycoside hydrolase TIM-barrel-like domain-containing protein, partial [Alphaproteobacteria bacterium]|nr:glycoside hydrolase TIM-barrel-like domain-containing protein [Alphaproteobacteria bacterium]
MASLVLGVVGAGLGTSLFGGAAFLGVTGAQLGGALGALLGNEIDAALTPNRHIARSGPRLTATPILASNEGAPILRLYGRMRVAGQVIWASRFKETVTKAHTGGGKGGGRTIIDTTEYLYSVSFAVGLCANATRIGRIWANGALLDPSHYTMRFYPGSETQTPDPLIADIEGADNAPAFRGLSYIVFEDMPLADFGNRIPQLSFEVFHNLSVTDPDALENRLTGVALIPGAGEFAYDAAIVNADDGEGTTSPLNAHNASGTADIDASLDELTALAPNLETVSLVVGWFGTDLRAANCEIRPGVESADKTTYPETWSVAGETRATAHVVSQIDGRPATGGTPSDASIISAIANLKARGKRVMLCPFVFMDIAPGNTLTDPYTGTTGQPAFPWRGRITCSPAPGVTGSPDKTATAATQLNTFFTQTNGYRHMILHYAQLAADAGGVDAFLIGS